MTIRKLLVQEPGAQSEIRASDQASNYALATTTVTGAGSVGLTSLTVDPTVHRYVLNNTSLLAVLTIVLPAAPFDGEAHRFVSRTGITALTITGGTAIGAPGSLSAGTPFALAYSAAAGAWFRDG